MQPHRSAVGDKQAVGFHRTNISAAQEFSQRLPEGTVALFGAILQEFGVVLAETFFGGPAQKVQRLERKLQIAEGQVNEARRDVKLRYLHRHFQITPL